MWKKIIEFENRFNHFCRTMRSEIDQLKKQASEVEKRKTPVLRHSGCNLKSPERLQGIW
jgi:hypothetical protein